VRVIPESRGEASSGIHRLASSVARPSSLCGFVRAAFSRHPATRLNRSGSSHFAQPAGMTTLFAAADAIGGVRQGWIVGLVKKPRGPILLLGRLRLWRFCLALVGRHAACGAREAALRVPRAVRLGHRMADFKF
jgi:hypothetical protein